MSSIWYKILVSIDHRNKLLQFRGVTLDKEVSYIDSLVEEMLNLRENFSTILQEAKFVAQAMASQIPTETEFSECRQKKRKCFHEEYGQNSSLETKEESYFRTNVIYRVIDCVISGLRDRFNNARKLTKIFQCLWQYLDKDEAEILVDELVHLKSNHKVSFGPSSLPPFELLNQIKNYSCYFQMYAMYALRLFCTLPESVTGAERSFSSLKRINPTVTLLWAKKDCVDLQLLLWSLN